MPAPTKKKARRPPARPKRSRAGGRSKSARVPKPKRQKTSPRKQRIKGRSGKKAAKPIRRRRAPAPARASKAREREKAQRHRQLEAAKREAAKREAEKRKREAAKLELQKKKAQLYLAKQRENKEKQKKLALLKRERERERQAKAQQRAKIARERERALIERRRAREKELRAREKVAALKRKEAEREAARKAALEARQAEQVKRQAEKEAERARKVAEREAAREEARRLKEEERVRKEAEREAYRVAKEAERERLRAEREAARRALEGKVARAKTRGQRAGGLGRSTTTRVYRPDAIPDQSGTTRKPAILAQVPAAPHVEPAPSLDLDPTPIAASEEPIAPAAPAQAPAAPATAPTAPAPGGEAPPEGALPQANRIEERFQLINERLQQASAEFQREYLESFDMSWIYHDSALEGVVYTFQELKTAVDPNITVVPDSSLQPVCEEIRRHRSAIDLVRDLAEKKRVPISVDTIKRIYLTLHPEEGDLKNVKYRKDVPQHRLYFHEYAPPDKIVHRVRQVVDWLNGPEPKKIKNPIRIAARAHYDLVRVFPFPQDSGKVARLLMNLKLLRAGYPPAIIHSTERQRYYEALKGQLPVIIAMISEAVSNALNSIEKKLDEHESRRPTLGQHAM
ncbi:MAG TPA: Fic family protein [Polyangiaceae bacterium]|jgi:Fic family protein